MITRQHIAAGRAEQSILDYVIVNEELYTQLEEIIIDDERIHVLTKYATTMENYLKVTTTFCMLSLN